ncbi:17.3 kDa class II heat shock protein-like [Physcomitrium patens]
MFSNEFAVNVLRAMLMLVILQVENENVLTMRGKRKSDWEAEDAQNAEGDVKFIRLELRPVKLMRKFTLPAVAKVDAISAACVDGVLTVTVSKLPPAKPE